MNRPEAEIDPADSAVLKAKFGRSWRLWAWVRRQFSVTSVATLVIVAGSAWGYIAYLRESVVAVRERVIVLETKVIPLVQEQDEQGALREMVRDHDERLKRLERNWDDAGQVAASTPPSGRRKH